jgi:hypothetical protein
MKINYKEPYWAKYQWDLGTHSKIQFVTHYNKEDNQELKDFMYGENYTITCKFRILEDYRRDPIFSVFGKPGKNLGLTYNSDSKVLAFEYWTDYNGSQDNFHWIGFDSIGEEDVKNGVTVTIVRRGDIFTVYRDFKMVNSGESPGNLIEDYRESGLFFGCANPGSDVEEHRHHGEVDLLYFSIIDGISDAELAEELYLTPSDRLLDKSFYSSILCVYDFKTINNVEIVYDESKNSNFLEKVPLEFIK